MDVLAILELAGAVPDLGQTIADATRLYKLANAGKPDFAAMDKAGTLEPAAAAVARLGAVADKLLKDPTHKASVVSLLSSMVT